MSVKVYIPCDAAALSMGAEDVAEAIAAQGGDDVTIIRNGSRGMLWLEPLVEVETRKGRVAYGPVSAGDVKSLFKADFLSGGTHKLSHGLTEEIDYLKNQERLTFARVGITDPLSLDEYKAHDGMAGLKNALSMEAVLSSGLRGRGGAGFPTGIKWKTALAQRISDDEGGQKYICANADEGDSGTFADRMLMEGDPFCLIEGLIIGGYAIGANTGYVYIRSEYPHAIRTMRRAIKICEDAGYLGENIQGSGVTFNLYVRVGAGAYICGEESSMLESLEGKRGEVKVKPPIPAISGLFNKPTIINNVLTLGSVPIILDKGADYYADFGQGRSKGTQPFQLAGDIKQGGLVEKAFGVTMRDLVEGFGGGTRSGRPVRAGQAGRKRRHARPWRAGRV